MEKSNLKIRCSALGLVMTDPRSKSEKLSETCKNYLAELFVQEKYRREKDIENKYMTKGLLVEEDSLTIYSRYKKKFFLKNEKQFENEWITGHPDIIVPFENPGPPEVRDIKSSWDIFTFFETHYAKLNKKYYWQLMGYMDLTSSSVGRLAYCLIDTPEQIINDEKRKLLWKMGVTTELDDNYLEACRKLDQLMTYGDIPITERVNEIVIERDKEAIEAIHDRVELCREYWEETYTPRFKLAAA